MDADILDLTDLFGRNRRYLVPLYQRPYVWRRDTHWGPLWADVEAVAETLLADDQPPRAHFIGAVVLEQVQSPAREIDARLIIDGQQRLTTLQLLLEAFSDACAARGLDKIHSKLVRLTRNEDLYTEEKDEQFKVWPTAVDQGPFRTVMLHRNAKDVRATFPADVNVGIPGALLYFTEVVEEWLEIPGHEPLARAEALYRTLREFIRLVVIDLAVDDDAQAIFETLNARGEPLRPSDLVKNGLLQRARDEGVEIEYAYRQFWKRFDDENEYWSAGVGRGHARRPRIDLFLQHFLTTQRRREIAVAHLYAEFREYLRASSKSAMEHMAALAGYADIFSSFDVEGGTSSVAVFFERIRPLEVGTAIPFLLEMLHRHGRSGVDLTPALEALESFLVRRMVCHLNTRGYNRFFLDLLTALEAPADDVAKSLTTRLLEGKADSNRWPGDAEFRRAWLAEPIYERQSQPRVRMLLEELERQMHTKHTERLSFGERLTIEHILPQEWETNWPLPEGATQEARVERALMLQTMGNLTLLTNRLNPKVSNGPWASKREALAANSILMLNRRLIEAEEWDEAKIRVRGEELFKAATKLWPRPLCEDDVAGALVAPGARPGADDQNASARGVALRANGPPKPTVVVPVNRKSTVDAPTKLVWTIADEMLRANPAVTRKEVVELCMERGITANTARTQYYYWLSARRGIPSDTRVTNDNGGSGGEVDYADRRTTLGIIDELNALGLDDARFRLLHHYPPERGAFRSRLQDHVEYCTKQGRFSNDGTNVDTARRLDACLASLREGRSWEEALREAQQRFPVPGREGL